MATFGVVGVRFAAQNVQQVNAAVAGFRRQLTFLSGSALKFGADSQRTAAQAGGSFRQIGSAAQWAATQVRAAAERQTAAVRMAARNEIEAVRRASAERLNILRTTSTQAMALALRDAEVQKRIARETAAAQIAAMQAANAARIATMRQQALLAKGALVGPTRVTQGRQIDANLAAEVAAIQRAEREKIKAIEASTRQQEQRISQSLRQRTRETQAQSQAQARIIAESQRQATFAINTNAAMQARAIQQTSRAIIVAIAQIERLRAALFGLASAFGRVALSALRFSVNLQAMGMGLRNFGHNLKSLGNELAAVGFRLGFLVSLPIGSFFANTVGNAMKFETEMTKIVTIVGIADSEVRNFADSITNMAVEMGKTPIELAKALFFITSSGARDSATAMNILTQSAKLSAIGFGETKSVASALVSAVRAYGEENLSAAEAADVLANTVRFGKIEAQKLSPALGRVIGIAAAMGVSFQEVGAFLAVFTQSGVEAGIAVTGLRAALSSILKPTGKARDLLAQLGYTVQDVQRFITDEEGEGLAKGLVAIARALEAANIPIVELFGNVRGLAGVLFNTGEAAQLYTQILDEMNRSLDDVASGGGVVETAFERVRATTAFQAEQMKAAWQVAAIAIGDIFLPAINRLLGGLIGVLGVLRDLAKARPGLILLATTLFLAVAALAPILVIMGLIKSIIGTLIGAFGGFVAVLGALLGPLGAVKIVLAGLAALFAISFSQIVAKLGVDVGRIRYIMNNELRPGLTDAGKAAMDGLTAEFGEDARHRFGGQLKKIADTSKTWGHNIVVQIANGMAQGMSAIVRALIQIGNLFRQWLAPGSPPALLPDLPDWGRNIMEQLMRGFMLADFSIFDSISSMMERFFRSLPTEVMSEEGLIPAIMGSRSVITAAINQLREIGHITGDVLQQIAGHFGPISSDIMGYISSLLNLENATNAVKAAQEKLNQVTEKWADRLRPITTELKSIRDRRKMMEEELRLARLRQILADPRAPAMARELAAMEIREIMLERQLRTQEGLRDAELEAANAELEAAREAQRVAQEQVDTQKALIEAQIRNNELMKEYLGIMERVANALDGAGGAGGGAGGIGSPINFDDFVPDTSGMPSLVDLIGAGMDDLKKPFEEFLNDWRKLWNDVKKEFEPLKPLFEELADVWSDVFIAIGKRAVQFRQEVVPKIIEKLEEFGDWLGRVAKAAQNLWTQVSDGLQPLANFRGEVSKINEEVAVANTEKQLGELAENLSKVSGELRTLREQLEFAREPAGKFALSIGFAVITVATLKGLLEEMLGSALLAGVLGGLNGFLEALAGILERVNKNLAEAKENFWNANENAREMFETLDAFLKGDIGLPEFIIRFITSWEKFKNDVGALTVNLVKIALLTFGGMFASLAGGVVQFAKEFLGHIAKFALDLIFKYIKPLVKDIIHQMTGRLPMGTLKKIEGWARDVLDWFEWLYDELVGGSVVPDMVDEIIKEFGTRMTGEIVTAIDTWITEMIQKFTNFGVDSITAIANGIASQLVALTTVLTTLLSSAVQAAIAALPESLRWLFDGSGFSFPNPLGGGGDSGTSSAPGTPPVASPPVSSPPVYSPGSGGSQPTSTFTMGGVTVNNGMDVAILESIIRRVVTESL